MGHVAHLQPDQVISLDSPRSALGVMTGCTWPLVTRLLNPGDHGFHQLDAGIGEGLPIRIEMPA